MKKTGNLLLVLSFIVLSLGCSNDDDKTPFGDYQINDISNIDLSSLKQENVNSFDGSGAEAAKVVFYGLKNNRIWLAIFDKKTKGLLVEYCFEDKIPQTIDLPYGEKFEIQDWNLDVSESGNLIFVDGSYYNHKVENGSPIYSGNSYSFAGPVFVNNVFVSLVSGVGYAFWYENSLIFNTPNGYLLIKNDGDSLFLKELPESNPDDIPMNYTMGYFWGYGVLRIHDLLAGDKTEVELKELNELVKNKETNWEHIYLTPQSVIGEDYVEFLCNVTFVSGAKKTFSIKISLSEKTYIWEEYK